MKAGFEEIYERYKDAVYGYLFYMTRDSDLAGDLAQETFLKIYLNMRKLKHQEHVKAWCLTIARNTFLSHARRKTSVSLEGEQLENIPTSSHSSPEEFYLCKEERMRIRQSLGQLSENDRTVLVLCDYEEMSYLEIASILGITESAVKVRIYRARRRFRQVYEETEVSYDNKQQSGGVL